MNRTIEHIAQREEETMTLAESLARGLRGGEIIALDGELGSGKTCFVRGLARGLGLRPELVSSPTFIICQEYRGDGPLTLVHVDAYRLSGDAELETIGWDEFAGAPDVVLAVEWPSRIAGTLANRPVIEVALEHVSASTRRVRLVLPDYVAAAMETCDE